MLVVTEQGRLQPTLPIISTSLGRYFTPQRLQFTRGSTFYFYENQVLSDSTLFLRVMCLVPISQDQPLRPSVVFPKEWNLDHFDLGPEGLDFELLIPAKTSA